MRLQGHLGSELRGSYETFVEASRKYQSQESPISIDAAPPEAEGTWLGRIGLVRSYPIVFGARALAWCSAWVSLATVASAAALIADVPIAGQEIALRASPKTDIPRRLSVVLRDPAIAAPLSDPRLGAVLRVRAGTGRGRCDARIGLYPAGWKELRGDGVRHGYRYRARRPGTRGIRRVTLRPGRIVIRGRGSELPCALTAPRQRVPLSVELDTTGQRYCAAFGGSVKRNQVDRFVARRAGPPTSCPTTPTNIVLLVADDLGFNDLGVQGSPVVPTPQIDGLAADGVRFTNAYATAASCSPSRAALLSGRYQQRLGFEFNTGPSRLAHAEGRGLDLSATTIADVLGGAGYATGLVGKWHLGTQDALHPLERGFDSFFGFLAGAHSYFPAGTIGHETLMRDRQPVEETAYLTDAFAREAGGFVTRHRDRPFFLYVSFNAVHTPIEAPDEYLSRFAHIADAKRRTYYAMVSALDAAVGAILGTIDRLGLSEQTLVVFTSDNGGVIGLGDNAPLRLGKTYLFEGGIRVPMLMRWPGVASPGRVHADTVSTLDLLPTFAAAADVPRPDEGELDGIDLGPSLRGEQPGPIHEYLFWRNGPNRAARRGDWKLVKAGEHVWLFDLATDVGEQTNLAATHPAVVGELLAALDEWEAQLVPPRWPGYSWTTMVDGVPYDMQL